MIPLRVVVRNILGDRSTQRSFAEEDHLAQALFLDRPHESFDPSMEVRGAGRKAKRFGPGVLQHGSERITVLPITIDDDESLAVDEPVEGIGQVSSDLHHPSRVGFGGREAYPSPPAVFAGRRLGGGAFGPTAPGEPGFLPASSQ